MNTTKNLFDKIEFKIVHMKLSTLNFSWELILVKLANCVVVYLFQIEHDFIYFVHAINLGQTTSDLD